MKKLSMLLQSELKFVTENVHVPTLEKLLKIEFVPAKSTEKMIYAIANYILKKIDK